VSDDELIQAARDGKEYASAFLISRFGPRLLGYCRAVAPRLSDPDRELVVELAIEHAVDKIDKFDSSRGRFEAWLRTFVLHSAQDWKRSHHQLLNLDAEMPTGRSLADTLAAAPLIPNTEQTSQRLAPMVDAVREHLPTMTLPDQLILALRDIEGRSFADIATLLNINPDACRQRHHRARARLKKLLDADPRTAAAIYGEHS
jgi:RNA polymerase sigma-70 factor (ECF subfamily)